MNLITKWRTLIHVIHQKVSMLLSQNEFCTVLMKKRFSSHLRIILLVLVISTFVSILILKKKSGECCGEASSNGTIITVDDDHDFIACIIPKLNPWDRRIKGFISHPSSYECDQVQPNLTFIDFDGYLRYNENALQSLNESGVFVTCVYKTFYRCCGSDDDCIEYSDENTLTEPAKLTADNVDVKCRDSNDIQIYHNIHAHPAESIDKVFATPTDDQLSLLLLVLDATSYSALQRNMPLTYNYTKEVMGAKYFEAYNKVADYTISNMLPILTGKRVISEQDDMMKEFDFDWGDIYPDTLPFIWKWFHGKGYATVFNEDEPQWGLFNLYAKGFARKQFDYRYRPYWLAVEKAKNSNHSSYCFANVPRPYIMLDITKRHVMTMNDKLHFVYTHIVECCHDEDNELERFDEELTNFFKEMYEKNYLNKTVIIFAADHGLRFGDVRATVLGKFEERLPFYSIWFPRWFYKLHPHIENNIDGNKNILSSNFDVYETMIDIVNANYEGRQREISSRGQSQLYPLSKQRTCKSAGIPGHYCTCVKEKSLNLTHPAVAEAGEALVDYLNEMLSNLTDICYKRNLKKNLRATQIDFDEKVKKGIGGYRSLEVYEENRRNASLMGIEPEEIVDRIRIQIETDPFEVRFEATLQNVTEKIYPSWIVDSEIIRTNKHDERSHCTEDKRLKKYCSCKN